MYSEIRLPHGAAQWRSSGSAGGLLISADGCVDLIARDGRVSVVGPSTRWIVSGSDGDDGGSFGFRLPPGHAAQLLGVELAEFADRLVPLDDVVGRRRAGPLREAMMRLADGPDEPLSLASIVARAAEASRWSAAVHSSAVNGVPATHAAASFGGSERSFRRRMLATFGYGYATLVRIERARRAQAILRRGAPIGEAAAAAGFADQPHLSREFRRLVGMSPGQFAASCA